MPVPIGLVGARPEAIENNSSFDFSFLANQIQTKEASGSTTLADRDADDLMKIWLKAKKFDNDTFIIGDGVELDNKDLIRLKSRGLISGGSEKIKFTSKAKTVISTMALGESNNFLKQKKPKNYSEILASMDKKDKAGYRIPKYAASSNLLDLSDK